MTKPVAKEPEMKPDKGEKKDKKENKSSGGGGTVVNLIVTSVVCLIFVGANYFLQAGLLKTELKTVTSDQSDVDQGLNQNKAEKGIILDLGEFTMNLSDVNPRRYLKVSVAIEVTDPYAATRPAQKSSGGHGGGHGGGAAKDPVLEEMEQYRPAIRDSIITVMTSKTSEELSTVTGKELAKQQITDAINDLFDGEREVMRVSFGDFIMQ